MDSTFVRALGIGVLVSCVIIAGRSAGFFESLELAAYDWTIRLRPVSTQPDSRIVLITVTEEDIRDQARWPLSDETVAQVLEILTRLGPRVIGLDLYRDIEVPPGRESLNRFLTHHREVITVMKFPDQQGRGIPGPAVLQGSDQIGFNDILVDRGGTVRRGFLFLEDKGQTSTSFAFLLAMRFLEEQGIVPRADSTHPRFLRLGNTIFPPLGSNDGSYVDADTRGYQFLLKFSKSKHPFQKYSLRTLLQGNVPQEAVAGKIVLVGMAADSVRDDFYTPYSHGPGVNQQIPGIELHAHIVSQLVRTAIEDDPPVRSWSEGVERVWILGWGILGSIIGLSGRTPWRFVLLLGGGWGILSVGVYVAFLNNWWIPLVSPLMAWMLAGGLVTAVVSKKERQDRTLLMRLFSQHVSSEIAEKIWDERHQFLEGGRLRSQKLTVTVLFADLEGFTSLAEQLSPQEVMNWLNTYLASMAKVVSAHGGVIDDYYGDGMKVNFGVPVPRTTDDAVRQDAVSAVRCGLTMMKEMAQLNKAQHKTLALPIGIRIGIATGPAVVGSLGSAQRLKYTSVGDTVNVAARLEQLGKENWGIKREHPGGTLFIADATQHYLGAIWKMREVGKFSLKGKKESISVYEVLEGPEKATS